MLKHIARIVAKYAENESPSGNYRLVLVCGLDEQDRIADGEWMGYTHNNDIHYPFVLSSERKEKLFVGGEEKYFEITSIYDNPLKVGERFSISSAPESDEPWSVKYQITAINKLL